MDDRKLTLIIVPHGELETRHYEIPYPVLKWVLIVAALLLLVLAGVVASWFPVAAQAGRARTLERELARLEDERVKVAELAQALEEVEAQYERVRALLGADAPAEGQPPVLPPLRPDTTRTEQETAFAPIDTWPLGTSGFITRALSTRPHHPGLDIAVAENSYIRAAGGGVVREAGENAVYGRYVIVAHGEGLESLYGHASRILVRAGDQVAASDVIGFTGSTGQSTGPHLHFEVRQNGRPVDPLQFVRQP